MRNTLLALLSFLCFFSIILVWTVDGESSAVAKEQIFDEVQRENSVIASVAFFAQSVSSIVESIAQYFGYQETVDPFEVNFFRGKVPFQLEENYRIGNNIKKKVKRSDNYNYYSVRESPNFLLQKPTLGFGVDSDLLDGEDIVEKKSQKNPSAATQMREVMSFVASASISSSPRWPCSNGFRAVPSTEVMRCGTGKKTVVPVTKFKFMSSTERASCVFKSGPSTLEVCVCAASHVWIVRSGLNARGSECVSRQLLASPRLSSRYTCENDVTVAGLKMDRRSESDFCLRVNRRAKIEMEVNTSFRWLGDEEMRNYFAVNNQPVLLGRPLRNITYITLAPVAVGSYSELERSSRLFYFIVPPNPADRNSFAMSRDHSLRRGGVFEKVIYPFAAPHLMRQQCTQVPLTVDNMRNYFGNGQKHFMYTIKSDLGLVGNEFVSGNTMYMEVGISGAGVPFDHRHARIWITFNDIPEPGNQFRYPKPFDPLVIAGLVFAAVLVFFALSALVWFCCAKRNNLNNESFLDTSDAKLIKKSQ